jgi:predicted ATPase
VGKTRLALSVAAALDAAYPDGVVFVDIAPVHDHRLVPATIARTLGLRETAGRSARELLLEYLDKRQILLVLDNFEQVLPAAPLVADLLRVAPRVRVLVTSRVPLRLSGEHEVRVPPMILPSAGASAPEVLASEAVQLFVQRARAVRADFSSTLVTAPLIGAICARLDGLPLAIELAAARARHLPLDVLLARLGHRLDILDRGPLDLPERQRTLRATLDWSYDLLPAAEQRLFVALGVFVGGCTAEAAAAVSVLPDAVEDKMWALVDSAMLECVDPGSAVGEQFGAPRFRMLETVREYALAHLAETGEAARIHGLHAQYYLALTERAESELAGPRQRDWLGRLEREHDNLRAALDWCQTATAAAETGLRLAAGLQWFWYLGGHLVEGVSRTEAALAQSRGAAPAARAKALYGAGHLAWMLGNHVVARQRLEESAATWRQLGDQRGLAHALAPLALILEPGAGRQVKAPVLLEESAALFRGLGDRWGLAIAVLGLGQAAFHQGDYVTARAQLDECLGISRQLGDAWLTAQTLNALGDLARSQSEDDRAVALYEESLSLFRAQRMQAGIPSLLHNLAHMALRRGDAVQARRMFHDSLTRFRDQGDRRGMAECLAGLAGVFGAMGQPERAARLFGAAEALVPEADATTYDSNREDYARSVASVRAQLDERSFAAGWAEGRTLPVDQVVSEALADPPRAARSRRHGPRRAYRRHERRRSAERGEELGPVVVTSDRS